jgi:hypothetical protein
MAVDELTRAIAALVAVVSLAMIDISVHLLPKCWNRFQHYSRTVSAPRRKLMSPLLVVSHLPIVLALIFALLGMKLPSYMPDIFIFVIIGMTLLVLLIEGGAEIKRRIKKETAVKIGKIEVYAPMYFTVLSYMTFSIFFNIFALIGVSSTMLLINIGPFEPENFEWGKWCLFIAIFAFCAGIGMFGLTLALDKTSHKKDNG